jgi:hypothetical protein
MTIPRRVIGKSISGGETYYFARERRNVVARAETLDELDEKLHHRDLVKGFIDKPQKKSTRKKLKVDDKPAESVDLDSDD